MPTSWTPFAEPGPRVTEDDIRRFEREFGYELPDDYRTFLLEVNGGYASRTHCVFTLRRGKSQDESILNSLFSLNAPDDQGDLARRRYTTAPIPSFRRDSSRSATTAWGAGSSCRWSGHTVARCGTLTPRTTARTGRPLASSGSSDGTCGSSRTASPSSWPG